MSTETVIERPTTSLNQKEQAFLKAAKRLFNENVDWFEFESFAFGMHSPVFAKSRSHSKVVESPLYLALRDMWLELGVRQGKVRDDSRGSEEGSR
jgi:hypothetical protein